MDNANDNYEDAWADQVPTDEADAAARKRMKDLQAKAGESTQKQADAYEAAYKEANEGDTK